MRVTSSDGTVIAYERAGTGPALVLVDPALGYREFDNVRALGERLAAQFTVYSYERRGRGRSGDTLPYAVEREIEDLAAVVAEAGGSANVYAFSSGGLLALQAAAVGVPIEKLVLMEPPIGADDDPAASAFTAEMSELVAAGRAFPDGLRRARGPARRDGAVDACARCRRAHDRLRLPDLHRDHHEPADEGVDTHPRARQPGKRR
jgi:pimeloyl-ACP methyl ester carboxylesterase